MKARSVARCNGSLTERAIWYDPQSDVRATGRGGGSFGATERKATGCTRQRNSPRISELSKPCQPEYLLDVAILWTD